MAKVKFYEDPEFLRRQTALLIGAILLGIGSIYLPLASLSVASTNALSSTTKIDITQVKVFGTYASISGINHNLNFFTSHAFFMIITAVLGLFTIMMYSKRKLQANLSRILGILWLASPGVVYWSTKKDIMETTNIPYSFSLEWGIALPLIAFIMSLYAAQLIMSDRKKIKASERFW